MSQLNNQDNQIQPEPAPLNKEQVVQQPQEQPKEPTLEEQFQRITKQERHVAEERKKIEEARKAFESQKADVEAYHKLKKLRTEDPFKVLEELGLTFDELQRKAIEKVNPQNPALEEVKKLRLELEEEKSKAEKEKLAKTEALLQTEIAKTVKENDFDIIEKLNLHDNVRHEMEKMFAENQEIPDIKVACEKVIENIFAQYQKIKDSKWLRPKEEPKKEEVIESVKASNTEAITNKMSQSNASTKKPMTEAERIKAAIKAMEMVRND